MITFKYNKLWNQQIGIKDWKTSKKSHHIFRTVNQDIYLKDFAPNQE